MARAFIVLGDDQYRAAAEKNLEFLRAHLWEEQSPDLAPPLAARRTGFRPASFRLCPSLRRDARPLRGHARPGAPSFAITLAEAMLAGFYDAANGGFYDSVGAGHELILRCKDDYDGAEPSGNSVAVLSLLRLAAITGRKEFADAAEKTLRLFAPRLHELPKPSRICSSPWIFCCTNRGARSSRAIPRKPGRRLCFAPSMQSISLEKLS